MSGLKLCNRVARLRQTRSRYTGMCGCLLSSRCISAGIDPRRNHQARHQSNHVNNADRTSWMSWDSTDNHTSRSAESTNEGKKLHIQHRPFGDEIRRLCEQGQLDRALAVLSMVDQHGSASPVDVYCSLLKSFSKTKALTQARVLHAHLVKRGLECSKSLGEFLMSTLVKCGGLEDALPLFHKLKQKSVVSWTVLISGYAAAGRGQEALRMYRWMLEEGLEPEKCTIVSVLRACGSLGDLQEARRVHCDAVKYACGSDSFVGACLVDMYSKCGSIVGAQSVFDSLPHRNVVSWTAILVACLQNGQPRKVLRLYERMRKEGLSPNRRAFLVVLQACGQLGEKNQGIGTLSFPEKQKVLNIGRALHADARKAGFESDLFVGNTLISMYGRCGSMVDAQDVFDRLSNRDLVSWNAMLSAFIEQGLEQRALLLYGQMKENGVEPDVRTFVRVLQACALLAEREEDIVDGQTIKLESFKRGQAIHADILRCGFQSDIFIASTLVAMYGKCGSLANAQKVFDGLSQRNVVSWTAMLAAYAQHGEAQKALAMYEQMQAEGVSPNDRTLVSALQACGILAEEEDSIMDGLYMKMGSLGRAKALHLDARRKGYDSDVFVGSTLISVYGKCGSTVDAQQVFEALPRRNVVSWNALIAAYAQLNEAEKAFELYEQMQHRGVLATEITLMCVLQACGSAGGLDVCRQIHRKIGSAKKVLSIVLANTLIHAYGRCASMVDAQHVFEEMEEPNVISWNALISGYARQGNNAASLQAYDAMQLVGIKPNGLTFLSVLSACSHAGLVHRGIEYFESMSKNHGISPKIEHYVCMVDLLGRAGQFGLIGDLLSTMPLQPNLSLWLCLLGACRQHGEVVLGKVAFDCAVRLQPRHAASYVLMSNICAHAGLWEYEKEVNQMEHMAGAWKKCGQSWIEHEQESRTFLVGDGKDAQHRHVYDMLEHFSLELQLH